MTEFAFDRNASYLHNLSELTDEELEEVGKAYSFAERDPTLNPRQKKEVDAILGRISFELVMRKGEHEQS